MSKNFSKPFYTVKINKNDCGLLFYINGSLITDWRTGDSASIELPINQWLVNGDNSFDYHLVNTVDVETNKRAQHKKGRFLVELSVGENGSEKRVVFSKTVYSGEDLTREDDGLSVNFSDVEGLEKSIIGSTGEGAFDIVSGDIEKSVDGDFFVGQYLQRKGKTHAQHITHEIKLFAPFPRWSFLNADKAESLSDLSQEKRDELKKDMLDVYLRISEAINNKDSEIIEEMFTKRSAEYDLAFYKEKGQTLFEFVAHILSIASDDKWSLKEIESNKSSINFSDNRQICWLSLVKRPMDSRLRFMHSSANLARDVPLFLSKFNGQWEIVR